jgi:uncharacterized protein
MRRHVALSFLVIALATSAAAQAPAPESKREAPGGGMSQVYLVLLKKGPTWSAEKTDATAKLMEAHLANIRRLWTEKKMIVAGPSGDDGDLRGVFVFDTASREEAQAWADSDPAVKAGRLVPELHSWWIERNALPAAGEYCQK